MFSAGSILLLRHLVLNHATNTILSYPYSVTLSHIFNSDISLVVLFRIELISYNLCALHLLYTMNKPMIGIFIPISFRPVR